MHRNASSFHSKPHKPRFLSRTSHVSTHHNNANRADHIPPSWRLYYSSREGHCSPFLWHITQTFPSAGIRKEQVEESQMTRWVFKCRKLPPSLHRRLKTERGLVHRCPFTDESYTIMLKRAS